MTILVNIIWFLFGGFATGLCYILYGAAFFITIIGIPFGMQLMRIGMFAISPFGRTVQYSNGASGCVNIFLNIVWLIACGVEIAIVHFAIGLFFYITIIGIPFGNQHMKLAKLALLPFSQIIN